MANNREAARWLADRAIFYHEEEGLEPKEALRVATQDLLCAIISNGTRMTVAGAMREAVHGVLGDLRPKPKREPRYKKVRRMLLERLPTDPGYAKQPHALTFGCDGEPFTSAHAYSLLVALEEEGVVKSVQIGTTDRRGWIKVKGKGPNGGASLEDGTPMEAQP